MVFRNKGFDMKILAVIVTHNRCALLSRCLDYLQSQTRQPNEILVINNASEDKTVEMLEHRGIHYITQDNVGSAGGWHRGIEYAIDHAFDAVWLMDDDGFPDASALAVLELALVPRVVCASSVVLCEDEPNHFVFPFPVLDDAGLPVLFSRRRKFLTLLELQPSAPDGTYPFAHFFNGSLVSVAAAAQIGNVNRDFFIFGDEVDYFFRLRQVGHVISVLDAKHFHPNVCERPYTPMKMYYYIKNTMILNVRYFNAPWLRHGMAIVAVIARTARRNGVGMALSMVAGSNASRFYSAIARGLQVKLGKDFDE